MPSNASFYLTIQILWREPFVEAWKTDPLCTGGHFYTDILYLFLRGTNIYIFVLVCFVSHFEHVFNMEKRDLNLTNK